MKKNNSLLYYFVFLFFVLMALAHYNHFLLFIIYGTTAVLLYPAVFKPLSHYFKIKHHKAVYIFIAVGVYLCSLPLVSSYSQYDERFLKHEEAAEKKQEEKDLQYEDSIRIQKQKEEASLQTVHELMTRKKFKAAGMLLDSLMDAGPANGDFMYDRAICLQKTGSTQKAVMVLKQSMELGNKKADSLFEKLNPLRKYIAGYMTRCCDGTSSGARGRGACSHHGGVCNWNEPVYGERRKYE